MTPHRFEAEHRKQLKDEHRRKVQPAQGILDRAAPLIHHALSAPGAGFYLQLAQVKIFTGAS